MSSERAWSHALQLKSDNAASIKMSRRVHHHSVQRFRKAAKFAGMLLSYCNIYCDKRTQLEAEAYNDVMNGYYFVEKSLFEDAQTCLKSASNVFENLAKASADNTCYEAMVTELHPLLRICRYNLGQKEEESAPKYEKNMGKKGKSILEYRGISINGVSEDLESELASCSERLTNARTDDAQSEEIGSITSSLGNISTLIGEKIIEAGGKDVDNLTLLKEYASQLTFLAQMQRDSHLFLFVFERWLINPSAESRPAEGVKHGTHIYDTLEAITKLDHPFTESEENQINVFKQIAKNSRCLFQGLHFFSLNRFDEAYVLLTMLYERPLPHISDIKIHEFQRVLPLFINFLEFYPKITQKWRLKALSHSVSEYYNLSLEPEHEEELKNLVEFPPRIKPMPCKPVLFDLASNYLQWPDISKPEKTEKSGGFMSRLGLNWFGEK
eukprot:GHVL01043844.1.p1 GENE.GHVL01043844.1~~GHVL01043844.1.p1  ORF type:complete len:440 (+),score=76.47 GHVL01043844.1:400-1719(+)